MAEIPIFVYPIKNPPSGFDTAKKHYLCSRISQAENDVADNINNTTACENQFIPKTESLTELFLYYPPYNLSYG